MKMTPLQIAMMLHYYAKAEPYAVREPMHACSEAVRDQRGCLIAMGLIETDNGSPSGFRVTERGVAYVQGLCNMPLPVSVTKWVMPELVA